MTPARRKRVRSNIRPDTGDIPGHRQWVRGHMCAVHNCTLGQIEAAHVRLGLPPDGRGGTGMKPHDKWCIPLCREHHAEQHRIGEATFAKRYKLDMVGTAEIMWKRSPHRAKWEAGNE